VAKVVAAIAPEPADAFIEIGPGRGALTRPLAAMAAHVVACEIDRDLAAGLRASGPANVTVVEGDFLEAQGTDLHRHAAAHLPPGGRLRIAGNLPYNAATPILFRLLELHRDALPFGDATVMVQREVADRLLAEPGGREYGVLSILVQHQAGLERLLSLPPGAFRPMPRVESSVVRLRVRPPAPPVRDPGVFTALTRAVFSRRRKTLSNALLAYPPAAGLGPAAVLEAAGIDGTRRPETLSIGEIARLSDVVAERLDNRAR
jgi:16S rRNA (adenine1518-N6/adenine1519-N6)-dimethyltransferase